MSIFCSNIFRISIACCDDRKRVSVPSGANVESKFTSSSSRGFVLAVDFQELFSSKFTFLEDVVVVVVVVVIVGFANAKEKLAGFWIVFFNILKVSPLFCCSSRILFTRTCNCIGVWSSMSFLCSWRKLRSVLLTGMVSTMTISSSLFSSLKTNDSKTVSFSCCLPAKIALWCFASTPVFCYETHFFFVKRYENKRMDGACKMERLTW